MFGMFQAMEIPACAAGAAGTAQWAEEICPLHRCNPSVVDAAPHAFYMYMEAGELTRCLRLICRGVWLKQPPASAAVPLRLG
jgi:hypothetical protein